MKNLKYIFIILLIISNLPLHSQSKNAENRGLLKGILIEKTYQNPIPYATISVFNSENNQLITGGISNEKGEFNIAVPFGIHTLIIESIAFKNKTINNVLIQKTQPIYDSGKLVLDNRAIALSEVTVTAEKSQLQFGLDQKVFTVGKDIAAAGGGVIDILDNIPSVTVDPQGQVSLRGSQSVKILIDGKPSAMTRADLLKNMQANTVDRIAIISNPSAKYDAEGLTGIINIILKKEKKIGTTGSFNSSISSPDDYSVGLNLNRRIDQINWFANVGLRYWQRPRSGYRESTFSRRDSTYLIRQEREQIRRSFSANINAGFDYFINKNNTLTTSILYDLGRQPHDAENFYQFNNNNNQLTSNELRLNDELEIESSLEYLLNYERKFEKKNQKLTAFIKYIDYQENNESDLKEFKTTSDKKALDDDHLKQQTTVKEQDKTLLFQADYAHPFNESTKGEFGAKNSIRNIENNYLVEELVEQDWTTLIGLSNDFLYQEKVYAVYGLFNHKKDRFSYQLGLRGELTHLKTKLAQTNEVNNRTPFLDLFPSVHLSYRLKNDNAFQLSYSRRIQRPRFSNLNPFFSYSDDRFIQIGNPNLNPMYTNALEIGYLKSWDKMSISSAIYHRRTKDVITDIVFLDDEGITFTQPQNLNQENVTGVEFFIENELTKWWKISGSLDGYHSIINGSTSQSEFLTNYYAWSGRITNKIRLPKTLQLQIKYFYRGPDATVLGTRKALSRFDISIRKQILAGKGRLSLSCMDLFNTYKFRYTEAAEGIQTVGFYQPWRRTVSLSFQYRWK